MKNSCQQIASFKTILMLGVDLKKMIDGLVRDGRVVADTSIA